MMPEQHTLLGGLDRHDVDADLRAAGARRERRAPQPLALARVDGGARPAEIEPRPVLYLNEHRGPTVLGDEIHLDPGDPHDAAAPGSGRARRSSGGWDRARADPAPPSARASRTPCDARSRTPATRGRAAP